MNSNKTNYFFGTILLFLVIASSPAFAILPPWYLLHNQLKAVLESDPCVKVGNLEGPLPSMEIIVNVCHYDKAKALSNFITKKHHFGGPMVDVKVIAFNQVIPAVNLPTDLDQVLLIINKALTGNKHYVKSYKNNYEGVQDHVYIELTPSVIQYNSDNYHDYYRNTNLVADVAFYEILGLSSNLNISTTTSLIE